MNFPSCSDPNESAKCPSPKQNLLFSEDSKSSTAELVTTNSMIYSYKAGHYHNKMSIPFVIIFATSIFNSKNDLLKYSYSRSLNGFLVLKFTQR